MLFLLKLCVGMHLIAAQDIVHIALPAGQDIIILCDVTGAGATSWRINGTSQLETLTELMDGTIAGHNRSERNIVVENIMMNDVRNGSLYQCVIVRDEPPNIMGNTTILYVAGVPSIVPNVRINNAYILHWGEPFNNLDPIVNYTVSCSGDVTCPPIFTTTDNTTRSYTITNLAPLTSYTFSVAATNSIGSGEVGLVLITTPSGNPDVVPYMMINEDSSRINGSNVTLTLSWGEPFSYFSPIISYTVSCSGDAQCPPNFTTTDNTTRSYTITNLIPMTNYTFSVVATNSIGSGEAGVGMVTTPPAIHQVTGIELTCKPVGLINQCIVTWDLVTEGNITEYRVNYNGTARKVDGSATTLKFTAPSLPDGEHDGIVMVVVIAINQFGIGPESDPEFTTIIASSVINAVTLLNTPDANNELHSITVNCTIRPESEADQCVVMAVADGRMNTTGSAPIIDGMAVVTVHLLHCEMTYNIIAEGRDYNGTLVGPGSSYRNITTGLCPSCESDDELSTELIIIISVVITFIITLVVTALVTHIITSLCYKRRCKAVEFKKIKADNNHDKNDSKQSFQCDDNSRYENIPTIKRVQADTEPEYATTSVVKVDTSDIRMDSNPAYVATDL